MSTHASASAARSAFIARNPLIDDVLARELSRRAAMVSLGGEVTARVAKTLGQTGALIALEAGEEDADLVVVGAHQRARSHGCGTARLLTVFFTRPPRTCS